MAARANIAINDGEATPVTHTFKPIGDAVGGVSQWQCLPASGVAVGAELIKLSIRPPMNGSPMYKMEARLYLPTLEVTSGGTGSGYVAAPTLAYANQFIITALLHQRSTQQERKNARLLGYNFQGNINPWQNAMELLEAVWG